MFGALKRGFRSVASLILAQAVLNIGLRLIVCQKFRGHVTSHAPLGKLFMHAVGIPHAKLLTKFEVCSPKNFQDI